MVTFTTNPRLIREQPERYRPADARPVIVRVGMTRATALAHSSCVPTRVVAFMANDPEGVAEHRAPCWYCNQEV